MEGEVCSFPATVYLICSVICMNRDVIHTHFLAVRPVRRECPAIPVGDPQLLYQSKLTPVNTIFAQINISFPCEAASRSPCRTEGLRCMDHFGFSGFFPPPSASLGLRSCVSGKVQ